MVAFISDAEFTSKVLNTKGIIVVDFYADWCGPCKMIAPMLDQFSTEYNGKITILKMNVDENQLTPSKFNIRSIPTMIAFKDGEQIDTKIGAGNRADLAAWFQKLSNQ